MATGSLLLRQSLRALVRCVPEEDSMTISLRLRGNTHHLKRLKDENVEKTLTRISLSDVKARKKEHRELLKKSSTKSHSATPTDLTPPTVKLYDADEREEIPTDTPNRAAWMEGAWLHVDDVRYKVLVNPPFVRSFQVMSCVMQGSPIVPQVDIEFGDPLLTRWVWWRVNKSMDDFLADFAVISNTSFEYPPATPTLSDSVKVHSSQVYCPTNEDIDKILLIECVPVGPDGGCGHPSYTYTKTVSPEPDLYPLTQRHLQTPCAAQYPQTLRVVSYNILADCYSTSEYATKVLFPYCPDHALQPDYRMGLVVREVSGYHPDIVCMQEVSLKWFNNYLTPSFKEKGLDGHIAVKSGNIAEGEATFFNSSRYQCIQTQTVSLKQFLHENINCRDLLEELNKAPSVLTSVSNKHTILQLTILRYPLAQCNNDRYIMVANTHLTFHPSDDNIRMIQIIICTRAIQQVLQEFKAGFPSGNQPDVALVFCGDFNSCPCTGGYNFITKGRVSSSHSNWTQYKYSLIPRCGCCDVTANTQYIINTNHGNSSDQTTDQSTLMEAELMKGVVPIIKQIVQDEFNGIDVSHNFCLQDSCGVQPYTNYTVGFTGVLDYIFSDSSLLSVDRVISLPEHDMVTANTALPSVVFPSDHLALVCDLKWRNR